MFFTRYIKNNQVYNKLLFYFFSVLIIFFRSLFRSSKKNKTNNIVIIALHRLGDSIFTFQAIKQIFNHHEKNIFLMCFTETVPIFKIVFDSINFVELNHNDFSFTNRIAKRRAIKVLKKIKASTIYDLTGTITSASLLFNCSAKEIIGINEPYFSSLYTKYTSIRKGPHITDIYLDAIRLVVPIKHYDFAEIKNNDLKEYILIHPFAGTSSKEWGLTKFLKLAEYLSKKFRCVIVTEPNKIPVEVLTEMNNGNVKYIETKSTAELIEVIKRCVMFIGNDSGPIHIANLLGKPTFTIYGPTNPDFHKPQKGMNGYIIKEIPCSPKQNEKMCFTHGGMIGCPSFECMNNLALDEVKKSVNEFISSVERYNIGITA